MDAPEVSVGSAAGTDGLQNPESWFEEVRTRLVPEGKRIRTFGTAVKNAVVLVVCVKFSKLGMVSERG
jgi:hypothetical protein